MNNELYHYGVPGMKWGHRKATYNSGSVFSQRRNENWNQKSQSYKRTSIGRGQNPNLGRTKHDYRTGETAIGKNISKYAKDAINNRNSKNKTSSSKKSTKKTTSTGKKKAKKILQKTGKKTLKASSNAIKTGMSVAKTLYKNPMAESAKKTSIYVDLASQMSPEYRHRYMYD